MKNKQAVLERNRGTGPQAETEGMANAKPLEQERLRCAPEPMGRLEPRVQMGSEWACRSDFAG